MPEYPFEIAFSFAGPERDRVVTIVERLGNKLGTDNVFYDKAFEHDIHGRDMDKKLASVYTEQARMVVVCLSAGYYERPWCVKEWEAISAWADTLKTAEDSAARLRLAILRLDETPTRGLSEFDQPHDVFRLNNQEIVDYLLNRYAKLWGETQRGTVKRGFKRFGLRSLSRPNGEGAVFAPNVPTPFETPCGAVLLPIAASAFQMGSPIKQRDSKPDEHLHEVRLTRGFHLAKTPISQAQWKCVMGVFPQRQEVEGDDHPVVQVSWHDAQSFCQRLSEMGSSGNGRYRLPSEAEWEFACRASPGANTPYPWGTRLAKAREYANLYDRSAHRAKHFAWSPVPWDDGYATTSPVAGFKPNPLGLCDMIGNVWEWCADWYGSYDLAPDENPSGPQSGTEKVLRGSSWYDPPERSRSACRHRLDPKQRSRHIGFRIAM